MIVTKISNQVSECINSNTLPAVVSEFTIKDLRYFVVATKPSQQENEINAALNTCLEHLNISAFSTIDRFVLGNQTCFIVEIQARIEEDPTDVASLLTARELQIATLVARTCSDGLSSPMQESREFCYSRRYGRADSHSDRGNI